jgi:hypothetical protein
LGPIPKLVEYLVGFDTFFRFFKNPKHNTRGEHLPRSYNPLLQFPPPPFYWGHLGWLCISPGVATWHWIILVKQRAGLDLHPGNWLRLLLHDSLLISA